MILVYKELEDLEIGYIARDGAGVNYEWTEEDYEYEVDDEEAIEELSEDSLDYLAKKLHISNDYTEWTEKEEYEVIEYVENHLEDFEEILDAFEEKAREQAEDEMSEDFDWGDYDLSNY